MKDSLIASPKDFLLPYQRRWVDDKSRFKIGCWARQTGKDFSTAAEIVEDMIENPKTMWMIVAPSERQSLESLDKVKTWLEAYSIVFTEDEVPLDDSDIRGASIVLPNGSRCIAVPGKPSTVRGMSCNVVFTEFSFFEDPDGTWKAVLPSITNPLRGGEKKVRIISTPNGKSGKGQRFYEILKDNFFSPVEGRKQVWSVHFVTLKDAIDDGLPVDYDALAAAINDPAAQAQEMDLEFLDGTYQLLAWDMINAAESAEAAMTPPIDYWLTTTETIYLGIDFGRSNDPTVCWACALVGDVMVTREVLYLRDVPSDRQEQILGLRIAKSFRTCFDYTGPGIGLGDYLVRAHTEWNPARKLPGKIELCTFTAQFKRELYPLLARRFQAPVRIRIPARNQDLRNDLAGMQQIVKGGAFFYDSPRTSEGHSDACVALALCNRAVGDGGGASFLPVPGTRQTNNISMSYDLIDWGNNIHLSSRPF